MRFWGLALVLVGTTAHADDDKVTLAREEFARGNGLAKTEQWAEALSAFQHSEELVDHPVTLYNIGTCERVIGHYTRARDAFVRALADRSKLPESTANEAQGYVGELDGLLSHVTLSMSPPETRISVDGRPLAVASKDPLVLTAGVRASGPGEEPPKTSFDLVIDPGPHVIVLSHKGFKDAIVRESFASGAKRKLDLSLEVLPASVLVSSNVPGAVVRVAGVDVGMAPVTVSRPAGDYRVVVAKDGYVVHETQLHLAPGDEAKIDAKLAVEKTPIYFRWWFWAGAAAVIGAGITITYFATRGPPDPKPYETGNTGWLVNPAPLRW